MSWALPTGVTISGKTYGHRSDFREILKVLSILGDESKSRLHRWYTAAFYFYQGQQPQSGEAFSYLEHFLTAGEQAAPGPKLFDWDQDAQLIAGAVNAVAGREVRGLAYLHWWTFLGYFRAIGEGPFATLVSIRDKRRRGAKLAPHEQEFARTHVHMLKLPSPDTEEKQRLEALLKGDADPSLRSG